MISNMTIITVQRARLEAENVVIKTFHTFGEKIAGLSVCRKINLWHGILPILSLIVFQICVATQDGWSSRAAAHQQG